MSWDIHIQDFGSYHVISDIPDDFQRRPLGPRSEIANAIVKIVPKADFTDFAWGLIEAGNASIEVNLGEEDPCTGFMLHVRGGEDAIPTVVALLRGLNMRGFDMQTGDFFEEAVGEQSFGRWSAYRDQVINEHVKSKSLSLRQRLFRIFQ